MLIWKYQGSSIIGVQGFDFTNDIVPPLKRGMKWPTDGQGDIFILEVVRGMKSLIYGVGPGNFPLIYTWNTDGSCNNQNSKWRLLVPIEIQNRKKGK